MNLASLPLISLLLLFMVVGVAAIWIFRATVMARRIALLTSVAGLLLSVLMLTGFDEQSAAFQFVETYSWIPTLNIHYRVGVDGLSILFLPLTTLMFVTMILASWKRIHIMPRVYYSLLLLLQATTLGIFTATDTILFMLFWELTLIPAYFLIALWGKGPNRRYAATKYILLMMAGGIPLLFGFVLLALGDVTASETPLVFDYALLREHPLPTSQQVLVFFLLFVGFTFKIPLFPFHTWLPVLTLEGPVAIGVIMTGLKLGAYGLIRFTIPLAPDAALQFHWLLAGLGLIGILYGALMAMQQSNLRSMLAYSSMSHVGLVVLSIASFDIQGVQGAVFQLLNFTLISGGLFLLAGFLYARTHSTEVISLGGVVSTMPLLAAFFFLLGIASIGIPGTSGFPAEFMMLISVLTSHTGAGLAALLGMVLGAVYLFTIYRQSFLGPVTHQVVAEAKDLQYRESLIMVVFLLLVFIGGLFPALVLDVMEVTLNAWLSGLQAGR